MKIYIWSLNQQAKKAICVYADQPSKRKTFYLNKIKFKLGLSHKHYLIAK